MTGGRRYLNNARIAQAVEELTTLILGRYPDADLTVGEGEDPDGVYITVAVDIDDPDEVTDLVIERTLALQIDEQVPVYVIPIRLAGVDAASPERARLAPQPSPG
jgi:hypothetical protein